jgi:Ca2+-binding EF-hand superfamily protein
VLDSQIRTRDKYLRNFVYLFKTVDTDSNGILNEEEFINLLAMMNIYSEKYFDENANRLLNIADPFNNKQITFSECVTLFSNENVMESDEQGNKVRLSMLDKVNLNDQILK